MIKSIRHPAGTRLEIFEEDEFEGGSFVTVNVGKVSDRPNSFICTTIRATEPGTGTFSQASLRFTDEDKCEVPLLTSANPYSEENYEDL